MPPVRWRPPITLHQTERKPGPRQAHFKRPPSAALRPPTPTPPTPPTTEPSFPAQSQQVLSTPGFLTPGETKKPAAKLTKFSREAERVSVAELLKLLSPTPNEVAARLKAECRSKDCARYLLLVGEYLEQQKLEAKRAERDLCVFRDAIADTDFQAGLDADYAVDVLAEELARGDQAWALSSVFGL